MGQSRRFDRPRQSLPVYPGLCCKTPVETNSRTVIPSVERHQRERLMMGRREDGQGQFFNSFDLDKVVPPDHLVRQIDGRSI